MQCSSTQNIFIGLKIDTWINETEESPEIISHIYGQLISNKGAKNI